jgi:hypothetical protein
MVQHHNSNSGIALLGFSGQGLAIRKGKGVVEDDYVEIIVFNVLVNLLFCSGGDYIVAGLAKYLSLHGKHGIAMARTQEKLCIGLWGDVHEQNTFIIHVIYQSYNTSECDKELRQDVAAGVGAAGRHI